jgi:hypothetical protein
MMQRKNPHIDIRVEPQLIEGLTLGGATSGCGRAASCCCSPAVLARHHRYIDPTLRASDGVDPAINSLAGIITRHAWQRLISRT